MLWLGSVEREWYQEYSYTQEFHVAPQYHDQSVRFLEAWQTYKYYLNKFQQQKTDTEKEEKTADSLDNLKAGFLAR